MNRRPKPGEDEDDLLKLQQEFLSGGQGRLSAPAATIKRPNSGVPGTQSSAENEGRNVTSMEGVESSLPKPPAPEQRSKFSSKTVTPIDSEKKKLGQKSRSDQEDQDMEELVDRQDRGFAAVLTTIIERDTRKEMYVMPTLGKQAFPQVVPLGQTKQSQEQRSQTSDKTRKKSLFAQQIEAQTSRPFGVDPEAVRRVNKFNGTVPTFSDSSSWSVQGSTAQRSFVVDGVGLSISKSQSESQKIHEENVGVLSAMSEKEILEEQQKLLQSLDPKLVEFLKNKRKAKEMSQNSEPPCAAKEQTFSVQKEMRKKQKREAGKGSVLSSGETDVDALPVKPNTDWINMSSVETEKLEWMRDLPPPPSSLAAQTGRPARFDFQGHVMAVDADVPVNLGLHHHGDEPERAGYTLEELFLLARSSSLQQRNLALHTLARVIHQAKSGYLRDKIETPLVPAILAGGVVLLLRWALDETVETTIAAAVDALHALLWSPCDEEATNHVWTWFHGHVTLALTPMATLEKEAESENMDFENKEEETDADVVKRDVLQALVTRMELLIRFRYIFQKTRPQATTVIKMLEILTRIAQHSTQLAYEIVKCPGLCETIINEFLPIAWLSSVGDEPVSRVYGLPLPAAMRLVRSLCQAGRNMASILVSKFNLTTRLLRYLAVHSKDLQLSPSEAVHLQAESLAVLRVCVTYGLAMQTYFDLYSHLLPSLGTLPTQWSSVYPTTRSELGQELFRLDSRLICVLEKVLLAAGGQPSSQSGSLQRDPYSETSAFPSANWSHVTELFQPIRACTVDCLTDMATTYAVKKQDLSLPTACLNFLASYHELESRQSGVDQVSSLEGIEHFCNTCFIPFLSSYGLSLIIERLSTCSNLLAQAENVFTETSSSLPSLCVCKVAAGRETTTNDYPSRVCDKWILNMPVLSPGSPYGFLGSLMRLTLALCRRHKAMIPKLINPIVNNKDVLVYLAKTCSVVKPCLGSAFLTRAENLLHYWWLKCCTLQNSQDMSLAHRVALQLIARVHHGDEHLVHDLICTVLFSPQFISEGEEPQLTSLGMEDLSFSENLHITSATQEEITLNKHGLLAQAMSSLAQIRGHFLMAFGGMEKALQDSRNLYMGRCDDIQSQLLQGTDSLMPSDWMFLPLIHVYNKITQSRTVSGGGVPPEAVAMVTSVLQWSYTLEVLRPAEMDRISVTLRLTRVMCAFIAASDLFLEKAVNQYLAGLLHSFTSARLLDRFNFDERIPGIASFYDLYQEFLDHYEAVSFGDPVFGLYVLLPLQQRHSSLLRKAVWGERRKLLRTLRVSFSELLIPVHNYLQPEETDVELLLLYLSALATKAVQTQWSPVLYLIAVHHLNRFIYVTSPDGHELVRTQMWRKILAEESQMKDVVYYKQATPSDPPGFELYQSLPASRAATLELRRHHGP